MPPDRKLVLLQTRRHERHRSSRDHHFNPTDVLYRFTASMGTPEYGPAPRPRRRLIGTPGHPWAPPRGPKVHKTRFEPGFVYFRARVNRTNDFNFL